MGFQITDTNGRELLNSDIHVLRGPADMVMHTHHSLEISCVIDGEAQYRIGSQVYDLLPGDIIILNNIEPHGLLIPAGVTMHHHVIHFDPSFIWNSMKSDFDYTFLLVFFERGERFSNRLSRSNPTTARIYELMREIRQEIDEQQVCYELIVKIKLQTIFAEIIRHYDYVDNTRAAKHIPEAHIELLKTVMVYIEENLDKDIRLVQLASLVHISPAYFSTMFKRFNGVSPVEYIVYRRVQRAIEMIRTTNYNLTEIAMACGFNNGTNFYKAFKKVTGRTPTSYRSGESRSTNPETK